MSDILSRIQALEATVAAQPSTSTPQSWQQQSGGAFALGSQAPAGSSGITLVTPVTLYSNSNPGSVPLTALDVSAYVSAAYSAVLLKVRGRSNSGVTGWRSIHLRASTTGDDYLGWESTSAGVDTDTEGHAELGLFPCSAGTVYYSIDSGIYDVVIRLYGWM